MMQFVYLHGLASSPNSKKARLLAERFAARGYTLHVPDLNAPDFARLTLTAMLERVAETMRTLPSGPVALIGSSLGGLTALAFADQYRRTEAMRVERLFLLAPALDFVENRRRALGEDGLQAWRESGWLDLYNYATGQPERLHYGLLEDVERYEAYAFDRLIPITIFHGRRDESVDYHQSVVFSQGRSYVDLNLVDSDHELLDQVDVIWEAICRACGIRPSPPAPLPEGEG